jgi:hypothetical protein
VLYHSQPIPVAVWSKAQVCGHSITGVAGSNPSEGMDVCCVQSSPTGCVCVCVCMYVYVCVYLIT